MACKCNNKGCQCDYRCKCKETTENDNLDNNETKCHCKHNLAKQKRVAREEILNE